MIFSGGTGLFPPTVPNLGKVVLNLNIGTHILPDCEFLLSDLKDETVDCLLSAGTFRKQYNFHDIHLRYKKSLLIEEKSNYH